MLPSIFEFMSLSLKHSWLHENVNVLNILAGLSALHPLPTDDYTASDVSNTIIGDINRAHYTFQSWAELEHKYWPMLPCITEEYRAASQKLLMDLNEPGLNAREVFDIRRELMDLKATAERQFLKRETAAVILLPLYTRRILYTLPPEHWMYRYLTQEITDWNMSLFHEKYTALIRDYLSMYPDKHNGFTLGQFLSRYRILDIYELNNSFIEGLNDLLIFRFEDPPVLELTNYLNTMIIEMAEAGDAAFFEKFGFWYIRDRMLLEMERRNPDRFDLLTTPNPFLPSAGD